MSEQQNSINTETRQKQIGLWAAGIFATLSVALAGISIYAVVVVQKGQFQVEDTVLMPTTIVLVVVSLLSYFLIQRGRHQAGVEILFVTIMVLPVIAALMIDNFEGIVTIYLAVFAPIMFLWILPQASRRRAVVVTTLVILTIIGIETWNPAFRGTSEFAISIVPVVTALTAVALLALIIRQSRDAVAKSLRLKITVRTGVLILALSVILIAYSTITARATAIETAKNEALAYASSEGYLIRVETEIPLNTARALAQALASIKDSRNTYGTLSRDTVNAMLRQILIENPAFLGTDTLWEPNAFDGQDAFYRGLDGHDETGRFIPYWVRGDDGSINLIPLEDYETPGKGDWYILPRLTKKEVVLAPLIYPINGVDTVMASFVVPILHDEKFYGIVGIDAPIAYVQKTVDTISLYEGKAEAFLITSTGTIIGFRNRPDLINQHITKVIPDYYETSQANVMAGKAFTALSPDGQSLRVFTPVELGKTDTYWHFGLIIPISQITATATQTATRQVVIGILLTILGLVLLWIFSGQTVRPIHALTVTANEISQGRLDTTVNIQAVDETGMLANAFNLMIAQLREMIGSLESRVAERTAKMERRNLDLALAAEVGQTVSQVRAINDMLKDAAEIIRTFFGLYYVQVYLFDPDKNELVLQFGTGEVGRQLVEQGHRLPLDENSINGRAAISRRSVVIADTVNSPSFRPNALLPDTRSEIAVPLLVGDTLIGVLDVQSNQAEGVSEEALLAFEPMSGQMAVAIQNARLVAEAQQARTEVERRSLDLALAAEVGQTVSQVRAINDMLKDAAEIIRTFFGLYYVQVYLFDPDKNELVLQFGTGEVGRQLVERGHHLPLDENSINGRAAIAKRSVVIEDTANSPSFRPNVLLPNTRSEIAVPLLVGDTLIGVLDVQSEQVGGVSEEALLAFEPMSGQMAVAIQNARLVAETQQARAEVEEQVHQTQAALAQAQAQYLLTQKLSDAGLLFTRASNFQDVVKIAVETLEIAEVNRAVLEIFNYNLENEVTGVDILANWWNGTGQKPTPVGAHYSTETLPLIRLFITSTPIFIEDAFLDTRIDDVSMQIVKKLDIHAIAILPFFIADRQLGVLLLEGEQPYEFKQDEARLLSAMAPQIATVLENRRQFERARQQAERESALNLISQKIQSATTVEAVLQIAAREIGHALGTPLTVAQLSMKDKE